VLHAGVWKGYMQSARDKFVVFRDQTVAGEAVDPFMWCLELAAEDDALSTHSVVELPVKSFEKRVDSLVTEFVNNYLPDDKAPLSVARAVEAYLFKTKGYTKADKQRVIDNEMYSPFRVYMNNVLPQVSHIFLEACRALKESFHMYVHTRRSFATRHRC
jgi:hypothetical protein